MGEPLPDCVTTVNDKTGLVRGDVRLNEFRSTDSLKRLKRSLQSADYDFCVIDTSPAYDNILSNVLTASGTLIIPVQQDIFSYQALKYQFEKLADPELDDLDIHIVFSQFEKPLTENMGAYRNQITSLFLDDEAFKPFINPSRISRSSAFRKYINKRSYRISGKDETQKSYEEIKALINSVRRMTMFFNRCPFCREFIKKGVVKCKYCQTGLENPMRTKSMSSPVPCLSATAIPLTNCLNQTI